MAPLSPAGRNALISILSIVLGPVVLYAAALLLFACLPWVQRQSLYAHHFHTNWWHDLDDPESFGFAREIVPSFSQV
jgi:hypothetical protein